MAVVLHTTCGDLPVLLRYQSCPLASFNFLALCASGYYDGCAFFRHFPHILLQTGDPTNTGKGGESIFARLPDPSSSAASSAVAAAGVFPGRYFVDEGFGTATHAHRGALAMAHKGTKPDTNASQFFITTSPQPAFDGVYTAFGAVDLDGIYDAAEGAVVEATSSSTAEAVAAPTAGVEASPSDSNQPPGKAVHAEKSGDAVLAALEKAAANVDTKNFVQDAARIRITHATVLYNPFAEGKIKL